MTLLTEPDQIEKMRIAGQGAANVLEMIGEHVKPGISTGELNDICHDYIVNELHAVPAALNYRGFPKSVCTSVNHQICHGIPSEKRLKNGDIINIDVAIIKDDYYGDTSKMFFAGKPSVLAQRLVKVTQECLYLAIDMVKPGQQLREIGAAIQKHAEANRFSVVREFCGHGVNTVFHDEPQVLHYDDPSVDFILEEGLTFTIEPMINAGKPHIRMLADNWTAVTKDHSLSAQWEHTLLVTNTGVEVLTKRAEEAF